MLLKQWIDYSGLRHSKVAQMLGIPSSTLYAYIQGRRCPSPEVAERIATLTEGNVTMKDHERAFEIYKGRPRGKKGWKKGKGRLVPKI